MLVSPWYKDVVGNTTKENSSIFSLITGMLALKLSANRILQFLTGRAS